MAATTLYQGNSGVVTSGDLASLYSRTFDAIRKQVESVEVEGAQFYAEESGNLSTMKIGEVSPVLDMPIERTDTDRVPLYAPLDGHNLTLTAVQRRAGIMVTKDAVNSQKTRMLASLMTGLPNAVKQLMEYAYASLWNGGVATYSTADGSYIFAADHTYEDQRAGAWDNLETGAAFASDSFYTAWLNMRKRCNAKGHPQPQTPTAVYYAHDIHEDVMKLKVSTQYPQNALNARLAPFFNDWRPVPSVYLTDTNAWTLVGNNDEAQRGFIIYWQVKPEYENLSDGMNPRLIWGKSVTLSFGVGALHSRNLQHNPGP